MNRKMKTIAGLLALLLTLALAGCAGAPQGSGNIELTDNDGNLVKLNKLPESIIVMLPSDVEILYALGAQDKIAAIGEYCNFPAEVSEKITVGTGDNTSVEQLVALKPDLIVMGKMAQLAEQTESIKAAGIPVYISDAQTIEETYGVIRALGALSGKKAESEQLVQDMKDGFAALEEKTAELEKKTAYVEISPLAFGLYTCGKGTFIDELLSAAGVLNVFGDQEGWAHLSEEQILAANPDVILTTSSEEYGLGVPTEEICSRPGWDVLSAVQNGAVVKIDNDACTRPGPRLVLAAEEMYEAVYGK